MTAHPEFPSSDRGARAHSFIHHVVSAALAQPALVVFTALGIVALGIWSFRRLPVDAYPDLSPPQVEIVSQWPGHAAEEVERLITVPIETEMNGTPELDVVRSISLYGLSDVRLVFKEGTDSYFARERVLERLRGIQVPDGVDPDVAPLFSPSGLVYRYVLESKDRSPMELKTLQDWVLSKAYKSVPGVADLSAFGGQTMQYQILLDPTKVAGKGLSIPAIATALGMNNGNSGGGFYSEGGQFYYVRGLGRLTTPEDIESVVLAVNDGTPILVKDVGRVQIGFAPRLGQFGFNTAPDAVEGVVLMRTGEQAQTVLKGVEAKTAELRQTLPKDVSIHPFYDRSDLISLTTRTVVENLLRGIVLVIIVLILFLLDARSGLIVAATIPLALFFAAICLDVKKIPANLLSIGAIDFGILVDGAVVMVENVYRSLAARRGTQFSLKAAIITAASEVDRPIVYAIAIIIAGFLPIYVLSGPSGRLFRPMADTTIFALVGALIVTLTLIPVLCAQLLKRGVEERRNHVLEAIRRWYGAALDWCLARPRTTVAASVAIFLAALALVPLIGAEFMPHLDEGALWVRATMPPTISLEESGRIVPQIRTILKSFPQVTDVASEHGRPDDGTNPTGFFNAEFFVGLKPYRDWTGPIGSKRALVDSIARQLSSFPGITFNYTQPAEDAVDEAETGLKSALAVKVFGPDLEVLESTARSIAKTMNGVRGIGHVLVVEELGQPSLTVQINRQKLARYGLNVSDVNGLIEAAVGGTSATQVVQGEKLFDLVVRLETRFRETPDEIGAILVATPAGGQVPLRELATIGVTSGAAFIYREENSRYIGVQFAVEGRDLASAVEEAQSKVAAAVPLQSGYRVEWGGEYQDYTESRTQLATVLPLTILLIFVLLFALYRNAKFPSITVIGVILSAPIGGFLALAITGTPFSVSSGIGFLALFGVSVQTAVVYISYANELRLSGMTIPAATREAALQRLRPIMMTALVAALGLLPAALATGVGSDSQKPFAMTIVGGLFSRLLISVFLMPVLYAAVSRDNDRLEV